MVKQIKLQDFWKLKKVIKSIYRFSALGDFSFEVDGRYVHYTGEALHQTWQILGYIKGQEIEEDSVIQFLNLAEALQMELESTNG